MSRIYLEQIDDSIVNTLRNVAGGIKKVSSRVDSVLNSPVSKFASVAQPEYGIPLYATATFGNQLLKSAGIVSDGLAGLADRKNYKKKDSNTVGKVVSNVLERVSNTAKEVAGTGLKFV
jgi:hypothetical protein